MGFGNAKTAAASSPDTIDPVTGARVRPVLAPGSTIGAATKTGDLSTPAAPDAVLAASQAGIAGAAAALRQRKKAGAAGDVGAGKPGAPTPGRTFNGIAGGVAKAIRPFTSKGGGY